MTLEYALNDSEALLTKELMKKIAEDSWKHIAKPEIKKIMKSMTPERIGKEIVKAIVQKAVFQLAVEQANESR